MIIYRDTKLLSLIIPNTEINIKNDFTVVMSLFIKLGELNENILTIDLIKNVFGLPIKIIEELVSRMVNLNLLGKEDEGKFSIQDNEFSGENVKRTINLRIQVIQDPLIVIKDYFKTIGDDELVIDSGILQELNKNREYLNIHSNILKMGDQILKVREDDVIQIMPLRDNNVNQMTIKWVKNNYVRKISLNANYPKLKSDLENLRKHLSKDTFKDNLIIDLHESLPNNYKIKIENLDESDEVMGIELSIQCLNGNNLGKFIEWVQCLGHIQDNAYMRKINLLKGWYVNSSITIHSKDLFVQHVLFAKSIIQNINSKYFDSHHVPINLFNSFSHQYSNTVDPDILFEVFWLLENSLGRLLAAKLIEEEVMR